MIKEDVGYFKDAKVLAEHIKYKNPGISSLRLQKTLYFLFAFYGNIFGEREGFPKYLFDEDFEAWAMGASLKSIYEGNRKGIIGKKEYLSKSNKDEQVLNMVDEAMQSINKIGDFYLIERTQQDEAWRNAYKEAYRENKKYGVMDRDEIIKDYEDLKKGR